MIQHNARGQAWSYANGNEKHLPVILDGEENPSQTAHGHGVLPSLAHLHLFPITESKTTSLSGSNFHSSRDPPLDKCLSSPAEVTTVCQIRPWSTLPDEWRYSLPHLSVLQPLPHDHDPHKPPSPRKLGEQGWASEVPSVRCCLQSVPPPCGQPCPGGKAALKRRRALVSSLQRTGQDSWWNSSLHLSHCLAVPVYPADCLAPAPSVFQAEDLSVKKFVFGL